MLPRTVIRNMLKHVDFLASDIPGFTFPVYLAGARMESYVVFGPTVGTAVNFALLSYEQKCSVGVSMDAAAITDPALLASCVRDGFDEVLAIGGPHEPAQLPAPTTRTGPNETRFARALIRQRRRSRLRHLRSPHDALGRRMPGGAGVRGARASARSNATST